LVCLIYHALASSQSKYSKSNCEEWRGRRNEGEREGEGRQGGTERGRAALRGGRGGICIEGREGQEGPVVAGGATAPDGADSCG